MCIPTTHAAFRTTTSRYGDAPAPAIACFPISSVAEYEQGLGRRFDPSDRARTPKYFGPRALLHRGVAQCGLGDWRVSGYVVFRSLAASSQYADAPTANPRRPPSPTRLDPCRKSPEPTRAKSPRVQIGDDRRAQERRTLDAKITSSPGSYLDLLCARIEVEPGQVRTGLERIRGGMRPSVHISPRSERESPS